MNDRLHYHILLLGQYSPTHFQLSNIMRITAGSNTNTTPDIFMYLQAHFREDTDVYLIYDVYFYSFYTHATFVHFKFRAVRLMQKLQRICIFIKDVRKISHCILFVLLFEHTELFLEV